MRLIFVILALLPACLYGARVALSPITEEKAMEWGTTKDQEEIQSISAAFEMEPQKMEEDSRLCGSKEDEGCEMMEELDSEITTMYKDAESKESAISPEKLTWYIRPYPIRGQCCYTRRWYVCPYKVYGRNPHTGTWGSWYAVQNVGNPWSGTCQILDYVSCQTGSCRSRCYTEYRTHSMLVSTFPITSWWQYVWALYHRQVFWVYVRVPSGCYCPNTFFPIKG